MAATESPSLKADVEAAPDPAADTIAALNDELSPSEKRALCRDDFWLFLNLVSYNFLAKKQTQWEPVPDHALSWDEQVETNPLNIILSGRKHTKTTWVLGKIMHKCQFNQGFKSLYWANVKTQVRERMGELEEMIEANLWLDNLHSGGEALGGKFSKTFDNGSGISTTWVTGAAEGDHVNLTVGDDPLKELGDISDQEIEAWYSKVLVPMLNRGGIHVIVGTRKRPHDLYEILRTKNDDEDDVFEDLPSYNLVEYPAVREPWERKYGVDRMDDLAPADLYTEVQAPTLAKALRLDGDTVSILWPAGRPAKWLAGKLGAQGYPYFAREFCMVFEEVDDAIISRADIRERCLVDDAPPDYVDTESPYTRTVIGVDPASTKGTDSSSFVVLGVRESGVRDVLHVFNAEAIDPARFKATLQDLDRRYAPSSIVIESNGMQQYIVDDAVEFDRSLPIQSESTTVKRHSWETGIPRIAHRVSNGGYTFFDEDEATGELINALTTLRMEEGRLIGHTPDPVSALYQAEKAIDTPIPVGEVTLGEDQFGANDVQASEEFRDSALGEAVYDQLSRYQ